MTGTVTALASRAAAWPLKLSATMEEAAQRIFTNAKPFDPFVRVYNRPKLRFSLSGARAGVTVAIREVPSTTTTGRRRPPASHRSRRDGWPNDHLCCGANNGDMERKSAAGHRGDRTGSSGESLSGHLQPGCLQLIVHSAHSSRSSGGTSGVIATILSICIFVPMAGGASENLPSKKCQTEVLQWLQRCDGNDNLRITCGELKKCGVDKPVTKKDDPLIYHLMSDGDGDGQVCEGRSSTSKKGNVVYGLGLATELKSCQFTSESAGRTCGNRPPWRATARRRCSRTKPSTPLSWS